ERFDALFDAFWFRRGMKSAVRVDSGGIAGRDQRRPRIWDQMPTDPGVAGSGPLEQLEQAAGSDADPPVGTGRLVASRGATMACTDLRTLTSPADMAEAEAVAERLARAIRYRLSRRRVPARHGDAVDLRRTIRRSIPRGGEPLELLR